MMSQAHAGSNPLGNGGPQLGFELVLDGLPGQGKSATITVEAWSWGASAMNEREDMFEPRKPGAKRPSVSTQDLNITLAQSPTSLRMLDAMVVKKVLPTVTLHLAQPISGHMFEIVMKDVTITSYQTGGYGRGNDLPTENLSMSFKKAKITTIGDGASHSVDIDNSH